MKTAVILISEQGDSVAQTVERETQGSRIARAEVASRWADFDAFVFIGAMGICVRTIAPLLRDKHTDPAVVCIDTFGRTAVAVLSGHVGGANDLTARLANALGAWPAITTQSDIAQLWPLDTIAQRFGWTLAQGDINAQIALFTAEKPTALLLAVRDKGTEWLENTLPRHVKVFSRLEDIRQEEFSLLIIVSPWRAEGVGISYIQYIPRIVEIGIGLAHQAQPANEIAAEIFATLNEKGIMREAVAGISSIEEKRGEPVLELLASDFPVSFYSAERLASVEVPNPSDTVRRHVSTPSVSEAAARLAAGGAGRLIAPKTKGEKWTVAAAVDPLSLRQGHVEIVGAGPGAPDLVSVRGRRLLQRADLILYAGSLVPRELTLCAKAGAVVRSSADMALEEQVELMRAFCEQGKLVVRLHTGDPCLYGAIQEQMNRLDKLHISYHITPGISAFQAAAAELNSQFTIPRRVQTIILTRGEGRTPMPEREKLHLLARSRSTMCIYLSADIVEKVEQELLMEYPPATPVAVCHRLTWPQQRIWRGRLDELTNIVRGNNLTLDTLIVVGEAIDNRHGLSELYSKDFSHLYRQAERK